MAIRKKKNHRTVKEKNDSRRTHGRAYPKGREER